MTEDSGVGLVNGSHTYIQTGVYELTLTLEDDDDGSGEAVYQYIVLFDPTAGFVTGGGQIYAAAGSYVSNPEIEGEARFGFVAKYHKVTKLPMGQTEFQFNVGNLNFASQSYDWLVVNRNDTNAQFKGEGTINGEPSPEGSLYSFMIWSSDSEPDTFRIKIWWMQANTEAIIFDNGTDQPIVHGNIVIHIK